jgi:hypothetical protein
MSIFSKAVGSPFYADSAFENLEVGFYTHGRYFIGDSISRQGSPDDIAVRKLAEAMEATATQY